MTGGRVTKEAPALLKIGTISVRLNFDLIKDSPQPAKKIRTRHRSDRLSVDDVWFDLSDDAIESVESDLETKTSESRFRFVNLRDQMTLWYMATVLLNACFLGNSILQEASSQAPRLDVLQINLNEATWEDLQLLEGVGEITAEKIISDREANGPYRTPDDLQRVSGIGPKTVEKLRPFVACEE